MPLSMERVQNSNIYVSCLLYWRMSVPLQYHLLSAWIPHPCAVFYFPFAILDLFFSRKMKWMNNIGHSVSLVHYIGMHDLNCHRPKGEILVFVNGFHPHFR